MLLPLYQNHIVAYSESLTANSNNGTVLRALVTLYPPLLISLEGKDYTMP